MDSSHGSLKTDIAVYVAILVLACVQVFVLKGNLVAMLIVAVIQAFLAVGFFMHLFSEKRSLFLALVPATIFVLMMMNMFWSDSFRLMHMRPFPK